MPTGCCLLPCTTVCWLTRSWQSWREAPTRRSLPRASSPRLLILPHRTAILKRRTPSLPCLRTPASIRLLCRHWQSGCMGNSARSKTVFPFYLLKTACIHRMQFRGLGVPQQAFCNANGVCIDRHIACRCRRCIYVCPACERYEASQRDFQI